MMTDRRWPADNAKTLARKLNFENALALAASMRYVRHYHSLPEAQRSGLMFKAGLIGTEAEVLKDHPDGGDVKVNEFLGDAYGFAEMCIRGNNAPLPVPFEEVAEWLGMSHEVLGTYAWCMSEMNRNAHDVWYRCITAQHASFVLCELIMIAAVTGGKLYPDDVLKNWAGVIETVEHYIGYKAAKLPPGEIADLGYSQEEIERDMDHAELEFNEAKKAVEEMDDE